MLIKGKRDQVQGQASGNTPQAPASGGAIEGFIYYPNNNNGVAGGIVAFHPPASPNWATVCLNGATHITSLQQRVQFDQTRSVASIALVRAECPGMKIYGLPRWDLFLPTDFGGTTTPTSPKWGDAGCPLPTAAMGDVPRDGISWHQTVIDLASLGYTWNQENAAAHGAPADPVTNGTGPITNPNSITFNHDPLVRDYRINGNKMKQNDPAWLDLTANYIEKAYNHIDIDGVILTPAKLVTALASTSSGPLMAHQLHPVVANAMAAGTSSEADAILQAWPDGSNGLGNGETFDDKSSTVYDVIEGHFAITRRIKAKGIPTVFAPDNATASSWRRQAHRDRYTVDYNIAHPGAQAGDAMSHWYAELRAMKDENDGFLLPTGTLGPFPEEPADLIDYLSADNGNLTYELGMA